MGNVVGLAVLVEERFAAYTRLRLDRSRRIVDARVDHLGIAARYLGTDEFVSFEDQHLATRPRQFPADRKSERPGPDDHRFATFSHVCGL